MGLPAQRDDFSRTVVPTIGNVLYKSMRELGTFQQQTTSSFRNIVESQAGAFRKNLWRKERKVSEESKSSNEIFLTELFDTPFTGQRRWTRDPRMTDKESKIRSNHFNKNDTPYSRNIDNKRATLLYFHCRKSRSAIRKCKSLKNFERIPRNLVARKHYKALDKRASGINIADYVAHAEMDDELLEIMLAIASERVFSQGFGEEKEDILHNNTEKDAEFNVTTSTLADILYIGNELYRTAGENINIPPTLMVTKEQEKRRYLPSSANYNLEHPNRVSKFISEITNENEKIAISKEMGKHLSYVSTTSMKKRESLIIEKQ